MKKYIIILIIIALAGGLFYFFKQNNSPDTAEKGNLPPQDILAEDLPPVEPDAVFSEPVTFGELKETYNAGAFSFKYDKGFKVSSTVQDNQQIVTVENAKGSGFQISIMAFDEKGPITPERIQQDVPDAQISDPKWADLDGVRTVLFTGYDDDLGETFELWPIYKGKLYQIMGPKTAEQLIVETLNTWDWK